MARTISPRLRRMAGEGDAPGGTPAPKTTAQKSTRPSAHAGLPDASSVAPAPGSLGLGAKLALIGGAIALGAITVVAVVVVVVLVVVPAISGGGGTGGDGSAGVELVDDIESEPSIAWEYSVAGDADADLIVDYEAVAVENHRALVMPVVSPDGTGQLDYTPVLTMLNLANGDAVWSIDLNATIEGTDARSLFVVTDIPGTATFLVNAKTTRGDSSAYVLAALNKSDGSVIATLESDVNPVYYPYEGDVVVGIYDPENDDFTISRHPVSGLDGDSVWEVDSLGARVFYLVEDFVVLLPGAADETNEVYSVIDGKEVTWGDDQNAAYVLVAGQLLDYDFTTTEVTGINNDGTAAWRNPVEAELFFPLSNAESRADLGNDLGSALLVADSSDAGFVSLQRLSPDTGDELWVESWDDEFARVLGVASNSVILFDGDNLVVLDLGSGEERFSVAVEFPKGVAFGSSMFYVQNEDEVIAYSYDDRSGDEVWAYDLHYAPELITQVGSNLLVYDRLTSTLYGLEAK